MACLDFWKNDGVEIMRNDRRTLSPSRTDVAKNPLTLTIDAGRLIDRNFADPFEHSDMELWSFKVLSDASCK